MVEKGYISELKNINKNGTTTYQISYTMTRKILSMYKKLNGLEPMAVTASSNPFFIKSINVTNRKYKKEMIYMNEYYKLKNKSDVTF